ncbi:Phosphotransferase enzyme family protein [Saccharopolyspora shandongensis]|uniref:Phosphotransferase enzyme family protein n=1 Tax=Saccharopolyspora shandongensis TaxID=418495 RepID=A0A1H3M0U6_9PSEU|nr:aminoglycoside phosphotransferase family protein [Saccharopolyspora shandongensis]SDY70312.1 Phosphotransferase enzyme family protein [Saccharopolyspora shandongensis]
MNDLSLAAVLNAASTRVGLRAAGAEVIRLGENALFRLPNGVVARIARSGQDAAAAKEIKVATWLEDNGVAAVRPLRDVEQPVAAFGRAVTFWHELPPHSQGTTSDVATVLRDFHSLPTPGFSLPELAPFVRLADRIDNARALSSGDRAWMSQRLSELESAYADLPEGMTRRVVHGDAWRGNVALTAAGPVLHDFERCSFGPPEWDLVSTAVGYVTTQMIDSEAWLAYCKIYGYDVTKWDGFEVLRDIRELRMTTMAAQIASTNPAIQPQLAHRLACLRGEHGSRPWPGWHPVP